MLKHMLGDSEVGFYATAVALANMWCFVIQAIIDSLNPSIMEDHKANNREKYIQKNIPANSDDLHHRRHCFRKREQHISKAAS
jgi:hypothetical protein